MKATDAERVGGGREGGGGLSLSPGLVKRGLGWAGERPQIAIDKQRGPEGGSGVESEEKNRRTCFVYFVFRSRTPENCAPGGVRAGVGGCEIRRDYHPADGRSHEVAEARGRGAKISRKLRKNAAQGYYHRGFLDPGRSSRPRSVDDIFTARPSVPDSRRSRISNQAKKYFSFRKKKLTIYFLVQKNICVKLL